MNTFDGYTKPKPFKDVMERQRFVANGVLYIKTGNITTSDFSSNAQVVRIGRQLDLTPYVWFEDDKEIKVKE